MFRLLAFLGYPVGVVAVSVGIYALVKGLGGRVEPTMFVVVGIGSIALGHIFRHLAREFKLRAEKLP